MSTIFTGPCCNPECRAERNDKNFSSDRAIYCRDCMKERNATRRALDADRSDRKCSGDCGRTLPADNFSSGSHKCKECIRVDCAARRDALDADRSDRKCTGPCGRTLPADNFSRSRYDCRECQRVGKLMCTYKLTPEDLERMWEEQGGECGLKCGDSLELKDTHVDHDHECCPGKKSCGQCVRMLLCQKCNVALSEKARWRIPGWVDRATELEDTHRVEREEAASAAYDDYGVDW